MSALLILAWTGWLLSDTGCAKPWGQSLPRPFFFGKEGFFGCDTRTLVPSCSLLSTASKRSSSARNSWTCFAPPTLLTSGTWRSTPLNTSGCISASLPSSSLSSASVNTRCQASSTLWTAYVEQRATYSLNGKTQKQPNSLKTMGIKIKSNQEDISSKNYVINHI